MLLLPLWFFRLFVSLLPNICNGDSSEDRTSIYRHWPSTISIPSLSNCCDTSSCGRCSRHRRMRGRSRRILADARCTLLATETVESQRSLHDRAPDRRKYIATSRMPLHFSTNANRRRYKHRPRDRRSQHSSISHWHSRQPSPYCNPRHRWCSAF